jgi:phage baseplate assembly protein W
MKLITDLIKQDLSILRERTGSRVARADYSGPIMILKPTGGTMGPNYYHDIRVRLEVRLNYLETRVEISDLAFQIDDESLRRLQEQAKSELAALDQQ